MRATVLMRGFVAVNTDVVEIVTDLWAERTVVFQSPQEVRLILGRVCEQPQVRRRELREGFSELAQFDERRIRVILKVSLGECAQAR